MPPGIVGSFDIDQARLAQSGRLAEFGLFGEVSLLNRDKGGQLLVGVPGSTNYTGPENVEFVPLDKRG